MRRIAIRIVFTVLAGVIVNSLVAWAFVTFTFSISNPMVALAPGPQLDRAIARAWPDDYAPVTSALVHEAIGVDWYQLNAGSGRSWMVQETVAGFPLRCVSGHWRATSLYGELRQTSGLLRFNIPRIGYRDLPMRPLWLPFIVNSLLYALLLWLLTLGPWQLRRTLRRQRKQCLACGYPIGASPVCTECGRKLA